MEQHIAFMATLNAQQTDAVEKQLDGVQVLALHDQPLSILAVQTLGAALRQNKSVKTLKLNNTKVTGVETAVLLDALEQRGLPIVSLDLSGNALHCQDCVTIGAALARNTVLEQLLLLSNNIDVMGALALRSGVERNITLTDVVLGTEALDLDHHALTDGNPFHGSLAGREYEFQMHAACRENRQQRNGRGQVMTADLRVARLGPYPETALRQRMEEERSSFSSCVLA